MNKKIPLGSAIAFLLIAITLTFTITMSVSWRMYNKQLESVADTQATYAKLGEVEQLIKQHYIGEINETELTDSLISGYIDGLGDKYAQYIPVSDTQTNTDSYNGKAVGIGITYIVHPDTGLPYVTLVHKGSSADTAGLLKGDVIVMINQTDVLTEEGQALMSEMVGNKGVTYTVTVSREGKYLDFYLTVSEYEFMSVTSYTIQDVGVVRISGFNTASVEQFKTAVKSFVESGVSGIVFDLRHNSGGSVPAVREMLDYVLPEGVLYTAEYSDGTKEEFKSDSVCIELPLAVLIDENTASAAELFAACIKDSHAGQLIGETTYGKGIMQRTFTLSDGSEVQFTVAYISTPMSGRYHEVGVLPNTTVILNDNAKKRFYLLTYDEDPQLQAAFNALTAIEETDDNSSSSK
ncbi:MAG: PDZ domain-containing protein [Clostridia bacterium]|nr:PDZ domain-containing protein [Clostridia bacterium]